MSNYGYYLDLDSGDFFARNFSLLANRKNNLLYGEEDVRVGTTFPAAPFESARDFQNKLKAPLVMTIVSSGLILTSALSFVKNSVLAIVNLIVFDFEQVDTFCIKAFIDIMALCYAGLSVVMDVSYSLVTLIAQTMITGYVLVTNGEWWEATQDVVNEDTIGFSESFLETSCSAMKDRLNQEDGLGSYLENTNGFFQPFSSDVRTHLKAPLVVPVSCLTGMLGMTLGMATHITLATINLAVLDFSQAWVDTKVAWHNFESAIFFVFMAIADTLYATTKLITRALTTADYAVGDAIDRYREPANPSILIPT
jgi:hypothetical protein